VSSNQQSDDRVRYGLVGAATTDALQQKFDIMMSWATPSQ
jgi:hypothetical protein